MIRRALREPLLHFLALGLALFLLHGWMNPAGSGSGETVIITAGRVQQLAATFALMHQREPTRDELDDLIDEAVREEILYREALALGLDQDDTIVRRRLRQKMEFVSEDVAAVAEPTDAQLQAYLDAHPETYRRETRYSFRHVFVDPMRRGAALDADVAEILATLQTPAPADIATLGDPFLLARQFDALPAAELVRLFGAPFEAALQTLPPGTWTGPVPSGYGLHLVELTQRDDSTPAALTDIRDKVRSDWLHDQRKQANARFYASVFARYEVTVEHPLAGATGVTGTAAAGAGATR